MKFFINLIIRFRWLLAIGIPLCTMLISYQLRHAQFDGSYRIWFAKDSTALQQYDAFKKTFGNDDAIIIAFKDKNGIFNKKALHVIQNLTQKLWETKYIARVDSLTDYQYIHKDPHLPDNIIVDDFIENIDKLNKQELLKKRKIALNEDLILNRIISKDATTTMIIGRLTPKAGDTIGASKHIMKDVKKYLQAEKSTGYKFYLAGGPVVNTTFSSLAKHDVKTYTPLVIFIAMLLLWLIFKKISGVIVTLLVVIFTFSIVLALQTIFGYKLNNFTANMPIFIIAIGIADAMHIFWVYLLARKSGLENYEAIRDTLQKNILPTFLTSLTTAIGFASLGISEIVPVKTLGIAVASAAILAFVLTILFVPAMLAILNLKVSVTKKPTQKKETSLFAKNYAHFIVHNDRLIIFIIGFISLFIAFGLTHLKVDSNAVRYFREDVPFRQTIKMIQTNLTGPLSYEVVVDSGKKDGIKNPIFMKTVEKFTKAFLQKYPDARHSSSLVDIVEKFNQIITDSKSIPNNNKLIAQYLLLYSFSLPQGMELNDKMDIDERLLRVTIAMNVVNSSKDLEMIHWIEKWWGKTPYTAQVNGQTAMFAHMQADVTATLIQSILLSILVTTIVMLFIFRNLKTIPFFLLPNLLPILLVIGFMGWLDIYVDLGVAISAAIILGIAIDDTIHFLIKYRESRRQGKSVEESLSYVMQYAGSAMILTTLVLSASFIVFHFSQFMLNANFGLITAVALTIALMIDLLFLPALLSRFDNKKTTIFQ